MPLNTSTDPQVGFRPPGQLDVDRSLDRYSGPFDSRHAAHLARRTGFGDAPDEVAALQSLGMEGAVGSRLHPTGADASFSEYPAGDLLNDVKRRNGAAQLWWYDRMLLTNRPFVEKMALFWHGHFATSMAKVPAPMMVQQIDLLRDQGLGNFHTLLVAISQNPAMLVWLDNRYNYKAHANENYARELMELFALGLGNYTEDDVKAAARAFTGWTLDRNSAFIVRPNLHDDSIKTFLGQTGNFDGHDILSIIVSQPIHQRFISRKLLEFFLYSDPEPELVEKVATVYALSGYNIAQVMGTLLRSNVFYSERAYRAIPKSPIEFTLGLLCYYGVPQVPPYLPGVVSRMGQNLLYPPSVKGWDGGPAWINTTTLLARFNYVNQLAQFRKKTPGMLTPDQIVASVGGLDADRILNWIVGTAIQNDLTGSMRAGLTSYMQAQNAPNPTPFGAENYDARIRGALALTLNLPSDQLN